MKINHLLNKIRSKKNIIKTFLIILLLGITLPLLSTTSNASTDITLTTGATLWFDTNQDDITEYRLKFDAADVEGGKALFTLYYNGEDVDSKILIKNSTNQFIYNGDIIVDMYLKDVIMGESKAVILQFEYPNESLIYGSKQTPDTGELIYDANCASCHGPDGTGLLPGQPDFTSADFWNSESQEELIDAVTNGVQGTAMPAFQGQLSEDEIRAVLEHESDFAGVSLVSLPDTIGEKIYSDNCEACHGADGSGALPGQPDFNNPSFWLNSGQTQLFNLVYNGKGAMPAQRSSYTEDEVLAVLKYEAQTFGGVSWNNIPVTEMTPTPTITPMPTQTPTPVETYPPLHARMTFTPTSPTVDEFVTFDASSSEGRVIRYGWDFNGDSNIDGIGKVIRHRFSTPGRHKITLRVENRYGVVNRHIQTIWVEEPTSTPIPDSDEDGLSDVEENELNTDHLNVDTDGDGLTDKQEVDEYNSNPLISDTDNDGVLDAKEIELKTIPINPDTDGDGLEDGDEVHKYGTNPTLSDTDSDGLTDLFEVDNNDLDPLNMDTDSDGLNDKDEIKKYNTEPSLKDTDGDGIIDGEDSRPLFKRGFITNNPERDLGILEDQGLMTTTGFVISIVGVFLQLVRE